ncbi:hypothetical protein LTV02_10385 [Nocardia yamanashiensis]|uniref:hypothetical protein n=1 Tax=Nocardia yamanashiensis TaxID=209247 RepID=UPI001E4756F6|nr:hypothetical protein [Nocardia yamanashiensis]UGT43757.1 hypothetical protein LTV02_10385 [Nocardia yamanashiensis]
MTPTLNGRLQTRVLVLGVVGLLVAAVLTPLLPSGALSLGQTYRMTLSILAAVVIAGIGWELLYHFVQQFRWEKDWPTLFGLVTIVNEGLLMGLLVYRTTVVVPRDLRPSALAFTIDFVLTWLAFWLFVNGPIRVLLPRWRFNGGRIV